MNALINRVIFVFSLIGLAVTSYLAYEYNLGGSINCPLTGTGCDLVRKSQYSSLLGISLPYFGMLFYLVVALMSVWLTDVRNKLVNSIRLLGVFSGVLFGVYLTFLEAFVIKAYCVWCLTSFAVSIIILVLALQEIIADKSKL